MRGVLEPFFRRVGLGVVLGALGSGVVTARSADSIQVKEDDESIRIQTPKLRAEIRKAGYVSGVAGGSLEDQETGFRDPGFGLHIADFLMEPGSDREYREELRDRMVYEYGDPVHGQRAKRKIEGPQICTMAQRLDPEVIEGDDFVAIRWTHRFPWSGPMWEAGSTWTQTIVFPEDKRYFLSADRIESVNASDALFARIDMPGHIKHDNGDTFDEIYLSYEPDPISSERFVEDFPPDTRFHYLRERDPVPRRMIRAARLQDPASGKAGPWLAGMTLNAGDVYEAWCHERGYVCFIQEIGGRPIQPGEAFGAAYVVGYFDSIEAMQAVYDEHAGHSGLAVGPEEWEWIDAPRD